MRLLSLIKRILLKGLKKPNFLQVGMKNWQHVWSSLLAFWQKCFFTLKEVYSLQKCEAVRVLQGVEHQQLVSDPMEASPYLSQIFPWAEKHTSCRTIYESLLVGQRNWLPGVNLSEQGGFTFIITSVFVSNVLPVFLQALFGNFVLQPQTM